MDTRLILTVTILVAVALLILAFLPHRVYVDEGSDLRLQTLLGSYKRIPLKDVTPRDIPAIESLPMARSFGLKIGKYASGNYYDIEAKQKYFLFLKGAQRRICFSYKGRLYVVDFPENADGWPLSAEKDTNAAGQ